jgi:hypothetical protein
MSFFDDSGPRPEEERSPVWRSFALIKDQLERLILVNLLWALQCAPLIAAWVFEMPPWLRLLLTLYSVVALIPATGLLFGLTEQLSQGVPLDKDLVLDCLKETWEPSLFKLLPLYSLFGLLGWAAYASGQQGWLLPDALARLLVLLLAVVSLYWGGLFALREDLAFTGMLAQSVRLFWRRPGRTLVMALVSLLTLLLGVVSIAGFFLIVPVLLALYQVQLYHSVVKG